MFGFAVQKAPHVAGLATLVLSAPVYGALAWVALVAPALGTFLLHGHGPVRPVAAHAVEWLFTCIAIGLLCALAWHRYA